jgi:hypothetical protein
MFAEVAQLRASRSASSPIFRSRTTKALGVTRSSTPPCTALSEDAIEEWVDPLFEVLAEGGVPNDTIDSIFFARDKRG